MLGQTISKRVREKSPCYKCELREPGCHGSCEKYANWVVPLLNARDARKRKMDAEAVRTDAVTKALKRRRQKNGQN